MFLFQSMIESFKFRMKSTILHVHRRLKSPAPASICFRSFASSSRDGGQDHYKTLGIGRDASAKEIKAAFYDLSKKYHPDMNPNDKEKAAMKFHNMNAAYEVLGSEEKRKIYDSLTVERHPSHRIQKYQRNMAHQEQNRERTRRAKDWSDLDLDYRDFEHFQRLSRRKRSFTQSSNNTADAFWEAHQKTAENYKNYRVLEREMLERQLLEELEERKRKSTIPVPTFDQLLREERAKKEKHRDKFKNISIIIMSIALFLLIIARYRKPPFGP